MRGRREGTGNSQFNTSRLGPGLRPYSVESSALQVPQSWVIAWMKCLEMLPEAALDTKPRSSKKTGWLTEGSEGKERPSVARVSS